MNHPNRLTVQVPRLPTQFNPLLASASVWCHRIAKHNLFESLVRREGDRWVGQLAASYRLGAGGRRLVFELRRDVQFHDGRPLTSSDVVYTIEQVLSRKSPNSLLRTELRADIIAVHQRGDHRVELRLRRPGRLLFAALADTVILPAHRYRRFGVRSRRLNRAPVGTGPYRLEPSDKKGELQLRRNEHYWGDRPAFERIILRRIDHPAHALAALKNGEVDLLGRLYFGYYPGQVRTRRFRRRFRILRLHPYRLRVLLLNQHRRQLEDRRVRQALAHLIDRQHLLRKLRNGLGQLASAPLWPPGNRYDRTLHPRSYDLRAAARLLDRAGWTRDRSGTRERLGHPWKLRILHARETGARTIAAHLAAQLRAVGGRADLAVADFGFLTTLLRRGKFDVAVATLALRPGGDLAPYLHSHGARNYGGYHDPRADQLLEALRGVRDAASEAAVGKRLHRVLYEDPPMVVIYAPIEIAIARAELTGLADDGRWPDLASLHWTRR